MPVDKQPFTSDPVVRDALQRILRLEIIANRLEASGFDSVVARRVIEASWESVRLFSDAADVMAQLKERLGELDSPTPWTRRRV